MKKPGECSSLEDIRYEIDLLDKEMVNLLGRRLGYVLAAAAFKKDEEDIPAPDRVRSMLAQRRTWARDCGLAEDFVEKLFIHITDWYIATQIGHWRQTYMPGRAGE